MLRWREQGRYEGAGAGGEERDEEVECLCICTWKSVEVCPWRVKVLTEAFFKIDDAVFAEFEWELFHGAIGGEGFAFLTWCGRG